jgi:integrase
MAKMKPPIIPPEQPVPVVPEDGLRRVLATCAGKSFEDRRDTALILLLVDIGPRRAELMGLTVADVDFDLDVLLVLGKGRRERGAAVRPQERGGARPLPARPRPPQGCWAAVAVAGEEGPADRVVVDVDGVDDADAVAIAVDQGGALPAADGVDIGNVHSPLSGVLLL